ncbi:imidazole glycerol phosphate synthase subunit HisH [Methylophilaceae bacterium]|jgi:glutamine amidotransferase|nr:imidazole glycerol phosphate synthase subunit HisH [Nitrosomonadales bacterium]MBT6356352.1 imidazole glycerol phosphate synthase subunit HisH [Nitrosomonadales bacterium]MCH9770884.1 imidazole glycerol phosphate synthase subunit HisH [Betaproteobacteria bacterium]MDA9086334.1 imidazole glycerol phosphate synthase subunit HisH [Methylophilaceae bacterium]|tara:strand:- start:21 stop:638 length:618 start_codon:yes stop_codon:yes gene_type:complete
MIAIIDYGIGNLKSVHNAVRYIAPKTPSKISSDPDFIRKADKVIFPGQGAMPDCIKELDKRGIRDVVIESAKKKPFLGICLGLQLLFNESEEGGVNGFGLFKGKIKKFKPSNQMRIKIPHMGWNKVQQTKNHPMWRKINSGSSFYFVHSFYAAGVESDFVAGTTNHGEEFTCAIAKDNIFAAQFHPEKSSELGLQLLDNFISWKV